MKILVIGSGGREHAIAWKLAQSPKIKKVFLAPGNAGTHYPPILENIPLNYACEDGNTLRMLADFAHRENISFTVVGPEAPLASGIVDIFHQCNLKIFGPTKAAAQLESSKSFAKAFMLRHKIPTAPYAVFSNLQEALNYLSSCKFPIVIKADGLSSGKGVFITGNIEEAQTITKQIFEAESKHDPASLVSPTIGPKKSIVIEKFLRGQEASFIVITDGSSIIPLATSQDHKKLLEEDKGPNTGGMGAYSPALVITPEIHDRIMSEVIRPALQGMAKEGIPYSGFLYAGIMITPDDNIYTLEFNCRLGDPETQVIMPRLKGDLAVIIESAINGSLHKENAIKWDKRFALGVVAATSGYPYKPHTGSTITFRGSKKLIPQLVQFPSKTQEAMIFYSAIRSESDQILTNGGRVLTVVAMANSMELARKEAYKALQEVHFTGIQYRKDIGYLALENKKQKIDGCNKS